MKSRFWRDFFMAKIRVLVKPNASRDEVGLNEQGDLWVRTKAPAQEGKANQAVLSILAGFFKLPKSALKLVGGKSSRIKVFEIDNFDCQPFIAKLKFESSD